MSGYSGQAYTGRKEVTVMTFPRHLLLTLACIVLACPMLFADDVHDVFCTFLTHQEQIDLDELNLDLDLARSEKQAAAEIFELVDGLWKNDAIERMVYLASKNDRDRTALNVDRLGQFILRQQAILDQYRTLCAVLNGAEKSAELKQANTRYLEADCAAREVEIKIGEVDVEYTRERVASVHDLRSNKVATRQDVIVAERNEKMSLQRLEDARARVAACRPEPGVP